MSSVPVIFDDGSKALVPQANLSAALKDGGKVAQAMQFDDGSKAYVTLDKVHDAIHDGGQLIGSAPQAPRPAMQEQPLSDIQTLGLPHLGTQVAGDVTRYAKEATASATSAGKSIANQVYDVSAPNIAEQLYKHLRGQPNNLKDLPPKMVLGFLAAGGLGEAEIAAPATRDAEEAPAAVRTPAPQAAAPAPVAAPVVKPFDFAGKPATSQPFEVAGRPAAAPAPVASDPTATESAAASALPVSAPTTDEVDPLLLRLRKIAADIEKKNAEDAAKKTTGRAPKAPKAPVVPDSDQDLLRLLRQSLQRVQEQKAAVQ